MKRKKSQGGGEETKTRQRILIFDLIRILCVAVIIYDHARFYLIPGVNQLFFADGYGLFNIYTAGLQGFAVYGMILISGAVLEYNYQGLEKLHGYLQFLFKRIIRLYPAFWTSLIVTLILFPFLWQRGLFDTLMEFTGFYVILGQGVGYINPMGWFIATILCLYILFPWFSRVVRKYQLWAVIGFCIISWGLRYLLLTYNLVPIENFARWFPLCNAFEFCLGIYIVQACLYPKKENTYPVVRTLSDMSFYAFLFHFLITGVFLFYFQQPLVAFDTMIAMNDPVIGSTLFYLQMMAGVVVFSWVAMVFDNRVTRWIMQTGRVRNFLKT
jgi:peptidoglycan/LPS O-acetylase OafA/YrhL